MIDAREMRVIYLVFYPLGGRDAERFGLKEIENAGLMVEVWDLSYFRHPLANTLGIESPDWVDVAACRSVDQFADLCSSLTGADVVIILGGLHWYELWQGRKFLRLLSASPARLGTISTGQTPTAMRNDERASTRESKVNKALGVLVNPRNWRRAASHLFNAFYYKALYFKRKVHLRTSIRALDNIWASTMVTGIAEIFVSSSTIITYIHTLDYDQILALRGSESSPETQVVFIDSMGPLHPDYLLVYGPSKISITKYSEIVCRGLDHIEKILGIDVVIAAHPRAPRGLMERWYGARRVIYGQTPNLISNATAVIISSGSTAIGMAVALRRPIVILNSKFFDSFVQERNFAAAEALGLAPNDLDAPEAINPLLDVNSDTYTNYMQKYVKRSDTLEEPFWSVVASEIISGARRQYSKRNT